ncbi:homocysteine S-methyltransferase [Corynebacterium lizhenjunii]|uniref:Homocysteine S-methyltransferase n=1 Tax=Corynebacterium lizhenjunii TaxID=2709394 RepID=A0A7T0KEH4_9CORY|nr:homocysteine S-methyltransferase [Corynebacterium lizhenjunii]QPK78790.1 homocysteine S-methyltransferase [Corynebacterium lizhenjunii]
MADFRIPLLFDGGLGTHLEARGNDISGALWSAAILRDNPAEVAAAHADFFAAGAQVATTCSYQVSFEALGEEAEVLLRRSVALARQSADAAASGSTAATAAPDGPAATAAPRGRGLVAASIGPYGAGPGEGTDYDGAYGIGKLALRQWHARRVRVLADTDADFLLAETIPNLDEVAVLLELLDAQPKPYALSITGVLAQDPRQVERVVALAADSGVGALGVNCCSAETAIAVIRQYAAATDLPLLAYPNSGEEWDHRARTWRRLSPQAMGLVEAAAALRDAGATHLGGCCRVTPAQIAALADRG